MSDAPEVEATYTGAAPRHYPALGLTVVPGETYLIPVGICHELADVFTPLAEKASKGPTTKKGED